MGFLHPPDPSLFVFRLSSLSSLGDSSSERRSPGHRRQPSDSSETTGLVQRCVIIQKDQHGFGFTVSGDRIVLVQSVRPGEVPPEKGGDFGVNGMMVTNSSHLEVVKLIKSGAYVALTLLGSPPPSVGLSNSQQDVSTPGAPRLAPACPPPPPPPPLPPPQRITGPKPLQDPEVQKHATQILRNMLRQEEAELQVRPSSPFPGRLSLDSQDGDSGLESGTERFPSVSEMSLNRNSVLSDHGLDSPRTSPVITSRLYQHHRRQGSDTPFAPTTEQGSERTGRPLIIGPEEDYDPGYFNNECDSLFQDLAKLKSRPAHLGVFLRYIFSQADPSPLLFYLCADVCQQAAAKDSRGLGKEIWNIFLERNAPLRVKVSEQLLAEIETRLRNGDDVRAALFEAQEMVMPEIQEQIQDYRTKRTMGLGSLYGENDLLDLDGDPQKERQVAEKQLAQLGDILSKYEEDRSSPMAFALSTYMNHTGIRSREPRVASASEKAQALPDKDKWLPFFPKAKKSSSAKKEKDAMEDKKRNPILKYIGKPKISSQSTFHVPLSPVEVKPGNVRNIIQHFENNQHYESQEPGTQRLSTGSFPEDLLEADGSRAEVKLGRSESLKGREEMKKSRKAENVPRSRSDVDMDAAAEATRLHQSASSSASSLSTRWEPLLEHKSIESPSLGFGVDPFLPHLLEDEQGQLSDLEPELDSQNWQHTVGREVLASLPQKEIDRQEVINELFATEGSHLRILRVLDLLFYQRMRKESLLSREELALLFPNLPDVIEIHNSLSESMKKLREEGPIIKEIGDLMLLTGLAKEEIQQVTADFCSYQSIALELIKTKQRKETRFQIFMQEAESNPQCRRLQLKDLIISEMQRLTKYPLLLENILKHTEAGTSEHDKLCRARDQCRDILKYVNEAVKQAENRHRLEGYQKRLDATSLERTSNPLAAEFKSLDLTSRRMIHEGPLTWRISKDKTVDLHVLLLEDLLVLLQKQDEKLVLKCHSKTALGSSDNKQSFSPVLKLNSVLIRSVATGRALGTRGGWRGDRRVLEHPPLLPPPPPPLPPPPLFARRRQASPLHHLHVGAGPPDLRAGGADVLRKKHVRRSGDGRWGRGGGAPLGASPHTPAPGAEGAALGHPGGWRCWRMRCRAPPGTPPSPPSAGPPSPPARPPPGEHSGGGLLGAQSVLVGTGGARLRGPSDPGGWGCGTPLLQKRLAGDLGVATMAPSPLSLLPPPRLTPVSTLVAWCCRIPTSPPSCPEAPAPRRRRRRAPQVSPPTPPPNCPIPRVGGAAPSPPHVPVSPQQTTIPPSCWARRSPRCSPRSRTAAR
uniref:Rho guanine nucleotide exchange factor 11 n=1 Tax=Anas platyrhynchos TaxID=8839 RepID=A0A8B9TEC5_ANAPL